jgi:hypothetical protein
LERLVGPAEQPIPVEPHVEQLARLQIEPQAVLLEQLVAPMEPPAVLLGRLVAPAEQPILVEPRLEQPAELQVRPQLIPVE